MKKTKHTNNKSKNIFIVRHISICKMHTALCSIQPLNDFSVIFAFTPFHLIMDCVFFILYKR